MAHPITFRDSSSNSILRGFFVTFVVDYNRLTSTAGFPATMVFAGTLLVTTAPAATTEFSPIVTPFKITAFIPIQTLSPIFTGAVFSFGRGGRFLKNGAKAWASIKRWAGSNG